MTPATRGRNDLWGGLILALGVVLAVTAFAGVSLFQIGAVAFFSWLALARKQGWAWIPAGIFGFQVAQDLLDGVGGSLFFPLMVVAAGVLMLSRERLSKNATIGILLMLAVIGIASNNRDDRQPPDLEAPPPPSAPAALEPPDEPDLIDLNLEGRELVVISRDADVSIRRSNNRNGGMAESDAGVSEQDDAVIVDAGASEEEIELFVPAETDVVVRTVTGDVTAATSGIPLDIDTVSGDIEVDLVGVHAVTAETTLGGIEPEGDLEDLDPSPKVLATEATGSRVRLRSHSGTITASVSLPR